MIIVKRMTIYLTRTPRRLSRAAALVAGLAAILAITSLSPVSAWAGTQAHSASAPGTPAPSFGAHQAALYPVERTLPVSFHGSCTTVRHELPKLAREGVKKVACTEPAPASSLSPRVRKELALNLCVPYHIIRTRHASCAVTTITFTILSTNGQVLGTGLIGVRWSEGLSSSTWRWGLNFRIGMLAASGDVAVGTVAVVGILCVNCAATLPFEVPLPVGLVWSHTFGITAHGGSVTTTRQYPDVQLGNPNASEPPPVILPSLGPARCDTIAVRGSRGCVFSDVAAVYLVYLTRHNEDGVAKNVQTGQRTKPHHFGWYGHGSPLIRATNPVVDRRNRRAACGNKHYPKPLTCDEYPFAATYQGAYYYPKDTSTAGVPGSQNFAEGGYRVGMYRTERLLNLDRYWVFVEP